ncbi:uncharacterized protein LOC122861173 [Aphidius gifuensis]|uniref:uncharacterized protein LOC122861173 n=1 Tax=Aphidius gifuensis TaxID=684658 RepID=UPI001CDD4620|nr:uncharacterized protein LOC122861173 [Aphidius gifuensis]
MMDRNTSYIVFVIIFTSYVTNATETVCDKSTCQGPLKHYESIGCKPVYHKEDDCCAYKYNCDHINDRKVDKCYLAGHEYNIREKIREEDRNPCDIGCTCLKTDRGATFNCAIVDCFSRAGPGCYNRRNATQCCPGKSICPKTPEERPTCEVNGKVYLDGQYFKFENANCYCGPGWSGKNIAPFCHTPTQDTCGVERRRGIEIKNYCAPVYYHGQNLQTSCSVAFRCENSRDVIIKNEEEKINENNDSKYHDSELKCKFGNMTLDIGDTLKPATDYSSVCVECTCEVPPLLTCQELSHEKCDFSKHEDFSKYRS